MVIYPYYNDYVAADIYGEGDTFGISGEISSILSIHKNKKQMTGGQWGFLTK